MEDIIAKIKESIAVFCECTGVPVTVYNPDGEIVLVWHSCPKKNFVQSLPVQMDD